MPEISNEQLIEIITREVMKIMSEGKNEIDDKSDDKSGMSAALVIGNADLLPPSIKSRHNILGIESYTCEEDIVKFEKIFLTELSLTELADIALGRNTRAVQCAVISGLQNGTEILLFDSALTFRKKSPSMSRGFYQLLEGYVRTLQGFGIKLVSGQTPIDKYTARSAPGGELPEGIITEAVAVSIVKKSSETTVFLKKGTVVTPSAKDVFLHSGKVIEIV